MKVKELRIGFNYLFNGYPVTLHAKELKYILDIGGEYNYEPIPLTEEWLLKFGFDNSKSSIGVFEIAYSLPHDFITVRIMSHDKGWWKIIENKNSIGLNLGNIEYVHQLQNLYFDLTGKELK